LKRLDSISAQSSRGLALANENDEQGNSTELLTEQAWPCFDQAVPVSKSTSDKKPQKKTHKGKKAFLGLVLSTGEEFCCQLFAK